MWRKLGAGNALSRSAPVPRGLGPSMRRAIASAEDDMVGVHSDGATTARQRVLIVDNSLDLARAVGALFRLEDDLEFVGCAQTGAEALRTVEEQPPDVLVLDLNLPDCSGFTVLERVRLRAPQVKVIIYTGHAAPNLATRARQLGACGCVLKGGDFAALVAAIRSA
jgi:two-component system, NarL family, nitrate/nitrite response regulator NarL